MTTLSSDLVDFKDAVDRRGLNLVGVCSGQEAQSLLLSGDNHALKNDLERASLLVVGSGGSQHWSRLSPSQRTQNNPIDEDAQEVVGAHLHLLLRGSRLLNLSQRDQFDLRRIGELGGFGHISPYLEMLIHPIFGPWISLRSLVVLPDKRPSTPLTSPHPCEPCKRPCLDACPANAYGRGHTFNTKACAEHRLLETSVERHCAHRCHSRAACIVGPEHRYGDDELRHRHRSGLEMLREYLGG